MVDIVDIVSIVGARPQFVKLAPVARALDDLPSVRHRVLHTGQHYDDRLSKIFFEELQLPKPHVDLAVGSGSHGVQTATMLTKLEAYLLERRPDVVLVYGDTNSTLAGTLAAAKLNVAVAHVEAGLRSFDRDMPEEINRVVTDSVSDLLFTSCRDADENLRKEGIPKERIHFVGNVMIDSLVRALPKAQNSAVLENLKLEKKAYVCVTLHRPSNVDEAGPLTQILETLEEISKTLKVVFPVHPRTQGVMSNMGWNAASDGLKIVEPLGYLDFIKLQKYCKFVLTDSGGLQEESTYMGVPCLTVRENTERPVTVTLGTNEIVGTDTRKIIDSAHRILAGNWKKGQIPPYWDGRAAERIVEILARHTTTRLQDTR